MKFLYLFLSFGAWSFFPQFYPTATPNYEVYVFLSEECIISQSYALELRDIHEEFTKAGFTFYGVFSNPASSPEKMAAFKQQYQFPFAFQHDRQQSLMDKFEVEFTPEVVVFDPATEEVLYQGRIDNTFYRVGRRRRVTTAFELTDALNALRANRPIPISSTPTIGCIITPAGDWIKNAPMCQPSPQE